MRIWGRFFLIGSFSLNCLKTDKKKWYAIDFLISAQCSERIKINVIGEFSLNQEQTSKENEWLNEYMFYPFQQYTQK